MHPRCRSTISAVIEGGKRTAKGKTIKVPSEMKYGEFKAAYLEKKDLQRAPAGSKILRGLAAEQTLDIRVEGAAPKLIGTIDVNDSAAVQQTIEYFESRIVNAPVENGVIITTGGEVYHCTGHLNGLPTIEELGDKLHGATVTHNHPTGSVNDYTFSSEDLELFFRFKISLLRGIDEKYVYELNRNAEDIDEITWGDLDGEQEDGHIVFTLKALEYGLGYRRWRRE